MNRRGFGLLELLIALTLTSLVAVLAWTVLSSSAFRLRERSERMALEHGLRVAAAAIRSTAETLGRDSTAGADLMAMAPDAMSARATRAGGVLCGAAAADLTVRSGPGWWSALRAPVPGRDSVLIGAVVGPARWIAAALSSNPIAGICPDGSSGLILPVALSASDLAAVGGGSPVRVFEPVELRYYSSSGATWLGQRGLTSAAPIQPLAGPFGGTGFAFGYRTLTGLPAGAPDAVALLEVRATALTERAGGVGLARVPLVRTDSTVHWVLLRNAP